MNLLNLFKKPKLELGELTNEQIAEGVRSLSGPEPVDKKMSNESESPWMTDDFDPKDVPMAKVKKARKPKAKPGTKLGTKKIKGCITKSVYTSKPPKQPLRVRQDKLCFDPTKLWEAVEAVRIKRKLTWDQANKQMGVNYGTIRRMGAGEAPHMNTFVKIIRWSGLDCRVFVDKHPPK